MPSGKKRKRHKMATHKRKKRLRKNRTRRSDLRDMRTSFQGVLVSLIFM